MCTATCTAIRMLLATGYDPVIRQEREGNDETIWYCGSPFCFGIELPRKRGPHRRHANPNPVLHPDPYPNPVRGCDGDTHTGGDRVLL